MAFVADSTIDVNGMSLQGYVKHASMQAILDKFPEGRLEGYNDPERGYDMDEVLFKDTVTGHTFYVYDRWGSVRIGARSTVPQSAVKNLELFIQASLPKLGRVS